MRVYAVEDNRPTCGLSENDLLQEIAMLREALGRCAAQIVELDRLANVDPLVNLSNRRSFLASLKTAVRRVEVDGCKTSILFLDVDGLKSINDKLGHHAGDRALVEVGRVLVASIRKDDLVARLAGDEFAILLEDADELSAWRTAHRVVHTLDRSEFQVGSAKQRLSVSIGLAIIRPGDSSEAVLQRADQDMYRAKGAAVRALTCSVPKEGSKFADSKLHLVESAVYTSTQTGLLSPLVRRA